MGVGKRSPELLPCLYREVQLERPAVESSGEPGSLCCMLLLAHQSLVYSTTDSELGQQHTGSLQSQKNEGLLRTSGAAATLRERASVRQVITASGFVELFQCGQVPQESRREIPLFIESSIL